MHLGANESNGSHTYKRNKNNIQFVLELNIAFELLLPIQFECSLNKNKIIKQAFGDEVNGEVKVVEMSIRI